ncbi:type II secretion system protein GspM [Pseudomonas sp. NPDC096917]|uniref:type II secretion system protein GspM n=1 Tax=Pseudomonas sp. NPDC096917 TaxID=3364483 RepID=UPI00383A3F34
MRRDVLGIRDKLKQLSRRDRQMLAVLAAFLLGIFAWYGLWEPAQKRLIATQALYLKHDDLAEIMKYAEPDPVEFDYDQPLSTRLSEMSKHTHLEFKQFEVEAQVIRMTINGSALHLLYWLGDIERRGAKIQAFSLVKLDKSDSGRWQVQIQINNA